MEKMEENKYETTTMNVKINEVYAETEIIQYYKNTLKSSIELSIKLPILKNCQINKFVMTMDNKVVISKVLEKEKAMNKYTDSISSGNFAFVSDYDENDTNYYSICLGNIPKSKELTLKSYYIQNITFNDLSYSFSLMENFPYFIYEDNSEKDKDKDVYSVENKNINGKINLETLSKLTRLVILNKTQYNKIEKKYSDENKKCEINFSKTNSSQYDIPLSLLFRTEKINEPKLYYQIDSIKNFNYISFNYTPLLVELKQINSNEIDEDENIKYESFEELEDIPSLFIFLIDQSGSMSGTPINLVSKALLLFLQSLPKDSYFQLIGFGSDYEYYNKEPTEYNKENIKEIFEKIKKLKADKGGTNIYSPLKDIFSKEVYNNISLPKYIFLLTDGEINDKDKTLTLISLNNFNFKILSLGIGDSFDKDLIERSALVGKGKSYFIKNLSEMNKNVISALTFTQRKYINEIQYDINLNKKYEFNTNDLVFSNEIYNSSFITDEEINDEKKIEVNLKGSYKGGKIEKKIEFLKDNIVKLENGDILGKIIIGNYLKKNETKEEVNLSKQFQILSKNTALFAEIQTENSLQEEMKTITNENKDITYNEKEKDKKKENKSIIDSLFKGIKNLFSKNTPTIIKKRQYKYIQPKQKDYVKKYAIKRCAYECSAPDFGFNDDVLAYKIYDNDDLVGSSGDDFSYTKSEKKAIKSHAIVEDCFIVPESNEKKSEKKKEKEEIKVEVKKMNFEEVILSQDIFDGFWEKNNETELLINENIDVYNKIVKFSEEKNVSDEKGSITILVLYYIFTKEPSKVEELKLIIKKAEKFLKSLYNLSFEDIQKEINL